MAFDPVCGRRIDGGLTPAAACLLVDGQGVYFCSNACANAYRQAAILAPAG